MRTSSGARRGSDAPPGRAAHLEEIDARDPGPPRTSQRSPVSQRAWVGGVATVAFLAVIKRGIVDGDRLFALDGALFLLHEHVLVNLAFGVLATGLLLSLFTRWGFFTFHWVTAKWAALAFLFLVDVTVLAPAVNGMAALSDVERARALGDPDYVRFEGRALLAALLLLAVLAAMVAVSVFKPWGRREKPLGISRRAALLAGGLLGSTLVAGAVLQGVQLHRFRTMPIEDVPLRDVPDGDYVGEADCGFRYVVEVSVCDHEIDRIRILRNRGGLYARLGERITERVARAQTPAVDAVTGATTTSKCLLKAVERALERGLEGRG